MIEPQRELSTTALANIKTVRSYNAFGEVARETSALGLDGSGNPVETGSLTYTYNTMGRVIKRESPQVAVTSAMGATSNVRPTEEYYYDKSGRMLASRDANGNLTRYTLLAGTGYGGAQALIAETVAADGGVTRARYDIHGDARQIETPLYNASTAPQYKRLQSFDKLGRLIQLTQEGGLVQSYEYDGLGQRTKYWNSQLGSSKAELIAYDHQGRIAQVTTMGGDVTAYAYGWNGALATSGMATYGGWTKTTTYANSKTLIESTDVFGRDVSRTDLGGNVSNFVYDRAGRLIQKTGGATRAYAYYNTGKLKGMGSAVWYEETIPGLLGGTEYTSYLSSSFEYDKAGNLTQQRTSESGTLEGNGYYDGEHQWVPGETNPFARTVSTQNATYDALGRLITWQDLGFQETRPRLRVPPTSHVFQYDANGNVRRSLATYRAIDAQGAYASTDTTQDYWYAYDAMNRMTISKGQLVSGAVARGTTGISMAFDLGGRRAYAIIQEAGSAKREDYTYDAENRLVETKSGTNLSTPGTKRADFTYDSMGRVTLQRDYDTNGTTILYSRSVTYNDKSQVASDSTATKRGSIIYTANSTYDYGTGSSYALGSPLTIMTVNFENGVQKKTNKTLNTYTWREGATLDKTEYWNDWVGAPTVKNISSYFYDIIGGKAQLKWVTIQDGRPRSVVFMYDQLGQIIKRDETDNITGAGDPHEVWYRFSGRQIGYVGNNGTLDTTYAQSIANRTAAQGNGAFFNGASGSTNAADFDLASDSLNSYAQGSSGGMYVVNQGDTLSSIASNLWGDAALWYKLAEANGLTAESELPEGLPLIIPTGVMRDSNTASTFKPYDPNELMGNLSPTATAPPKKGKNCGVIGQIIMVVIAVVVTIWTAGAASGIFAAMGGATGAGAGMMAGGAMALSGGGMLATGAGAIAAGAIGGAVGSIVSQAVGVMTGIQEKFSWNAVALAAIGGGVGASGFGNAVANGVGATTGIANAAVSAMAGNALTQGIGVATGLQDKFSWAGVAAAGVGAGIAEKVMPNATLRGLRTSAGQTSSAYLTAFAMRGGASALASAATRSLIEGSDFGDNVLAALPDVIGNTIGEMIAGRLSGRPVAAEQNPQEEATSALENAGLPTDVLENFDAAALREQGYRAGSYDVIIGKDGRGFRDTGSAGESNTDGIGTIFTDEDGGNAQSRRYTVDWVAWGNEDAVSFISREGGARTLLSLGVYNETYGVTTSIGRFEMSTIQRADAEVGRQRVLEQRRTELEVGYLTQSAAVRDYVNRNIDAPAAEFVLRNLPITGTVYAYDDFQKDPTVLNGVVLGASVFGDAAAAASILRSGARGASVVDEAARLPGAAKGCFVAGTLVHTIDGLKPIEHVQVGDLVLSRPEKGGSTGMRRVNEVFRFEQKVIWKIEVTTPEGRVESYSATGNHPFWVEGIGWTGAEYLEPGQALRLSDGSTVNVVYAENTRGSTTVYNFEVDGWHTYHVGQLGVWVHNQNCWGELPEAIQRDLVSLGITAERYSVEGSNLTLRIGHIGGRDVANAGARTGAMLRAIRHFRSAGSGIDNIVIHTGPVVNSQTLGPRLARLAATGREYNGMRVTRVADQWSGRERAPAYMLQWWRD